MKIISVQTIREQLDLKRIYGEDITIEDVIKTKVKLYKFNPDKMEKYIEEYYFGAYDFINCTKHFITGVLFKKFVSGIEDEGFKEWFIKDVHEHVFQETVGI